MASYPQGTFGGYLDSGGVYYVTYTPTPEPGTVIGIAAAGLGLVGWVRRRRNGRSAPAA